MPFLGGSYDMDSSIFLGGGGGGGGEMKNGGPRLRATCMGGGVGEFGSHEAP